MLILQPGTRFVRYFAYAGVLFAVLFKLAGPPSFPFAAALSISCAIFLAAFLYDVICSALESLVREER